MIGVSDPIEVQTRRAPNRKGPWNSWDPVEATSLFSFKKLPAVGIEDVNTCYSCKVLWDSAARDHVPHPVQKCMVDKFVNRNSLCSISNPLPVFWA